MALFGGKDLPEEARDRTMLSLKQVASRNVDELLSRDIGVLVDELVDDFEPVTIHWDEVTMTEPTQEQWIRYDGFGSHSSRAMAQSIVKVPLDGEAKLLTYRSHSGAPMSTIEGEARPGLVFFTWAGGLDASGSAITQWFKERQDQVESFLLYNNGDLPALNQQMRSEVLEAIELRCDQELKRRNLASSLPFPIERRPGAVRPVPVQRRKVRLRDPARMPSFAPEPQLDSETYEEVLRDCVAMATVFERMPLGGNMGEEELRNVILGMLNTNFTGQVAGELFNGAGKTDICIRVEDRNVFIGECKFYNGPRSVTKAIDQLLGYVVWRDTKAALLLFVRGGNFTEVIEKAVEAVANHPQCQRRPPSADRSRRSDFLFTRADDPDRAILLALLPFQLTA
jgi:hypothetical protein